MRAMKRDAKERPIIDALEQAGFLVLQLPITPDLVVKNPSTGELTLLEVEGVNKHRKRGLSQLQLLKIWRIPRVKTPEEALRAVAAL